jgi:hypothetical protein
MFQRPYRHVPTSELEAARDARFARVQHLVNNHYTVLVGPMRRELARITRELDYRSKETK